MLSHAIASDLTILLNAAQNLHIIDGWKELGTVIMIRRSNANFYVKPDGLEPLLKNFCAEC